MDNRCQVCGLSLGPTNDPGVELCANSVQGEACARDIGLLVEWPYHNDKLPLAWVEGSLTRSEGCPLTRAEIKIVQDGLDNLDDYYRNS